MKHVWGYWNSTLYFNAPVKKFVEVSTDNGALLFSQKLEHARTCVDVELSEGRYIIKTVSELGQCEELLCVLN